MPLPPMRLMLPLLNMGMRAAGLAGRFGLALYLVKYLSLADVGLFGLITGMTGIVPALIGWGLNYYLNREIVGKTRLVSGRMVRDRLLVTLLSLAVLVAVALPFLLTGAWVPSALLAALIVTVVVLECIAFDMHGALISFGHPLAANILLFVRSAAWAFPAIGLGIIVPELRSLEVVFGLWAVGLGISFAVMLWVLRGWPLRQIAKEPVDKAWVGGTLKRSWLIYLNDIGIVGTLYLDRYVVNHFLGLEQTGIFTLFWQVANAVHVLVSTGITQLALPKLVRLHNEAKTTEWVAELKKTVASVGMAGAVISVVAAAAFPPLLVLMGKGDVAAFSGVFYVVLAGVCVRLVADATGLGLYSRHLDRPLAVINLVSMPLALACSAAGVMLLGLVGVGVGIIVTQLILLIMRLHVLTHGGYRASKHSTMTQPASLTEET